MSVLQVPRLLDTSMKHCTTRAPWWRSLALGGLLVISLLMVVGLARVTPSDPNSTAPLTPFLRNWSLLFIPYAAACTLVLFSRPVSGRWRRVEIGLILSGALFLRALLVPLSPNLSHDSWRYVWDARVFLHGYSPYTTIPAEKALVPLRDFIYANSRFRTVPTLYPPGAQYIYIVSYLLAPASLFFLKGIFLLFDLGNCILLACILIRKGQDPARMLLYAWCPLPIVEFALQGHVDVLTITFTLLAVLCASDRSQRGRVLTGFFVGLGTLTKIYPVLMLAAFIRPRAWRRDWLLVCSCLLTILLGYLPFFIQGHSQIFGFFGSYANEQGQNAGIFQQGVAWFAHMRHLPLATTITLEHSLALLLIGGTACALLFSRRSQHTNLEGSILLLFGLILAVSSHVFPWYTTTLLPWIVLLLPTREELTPRLLRLARLLALCSLWFFTALSILGYIQDWSLYYRVVYMPLVIALFLAVLLFLAQLLVLRQKGTVCEKRSINIKQ